MSGVDEMVDGRGTLRPHWRGVLGALSNLGPGQLAARMARLERAGEGAAWRCDPVPLPLTAAEFAGLEAGLQQRARLLEAVLADIYGAQSMLADGALPPALVLANPAFLRACRARPQPGGPGRFLHAYAADLVRGPDGTWRVLADRTGGMMGIGYARESRRLLARVVPELFRAAQICQLRPFLDAWQDALLHAAPPTGGRPPFVALLTPSMDDPHWAEHLALSRDLSCALVQAEDLSVREGALHHETLAGLQRVDVLVRRVPGAGLDGVELPGAPGVPGLLQAARQGAVRILNHPGAATVEAPGLAAFMPALCRRLLGEPLRLATVPTIWLADDGAQRTVAQGFERWFVRPALDPSAPPVALRSLSRPSRAELEAQIAAAPWRFAACTAVTPSQAPCHGPDGLTPRPVVLRLYLIHDGAGWRTMQGGLARALHPGEHVAEALPAGAVFKDVWVLTDETGHISGPPPATPARMAVRRGGGTLSGRVAEGFFRLGQVVERLDAVARLGRAGLLRWARGTPLPREAAELHVLGQCLCAAGLAEDDVQLDHAIRASLHGGAVAAGLAEVSRLTEALRDRLTAETCTLLGQAVRAAQAEAHEAPAAGVDGLVDALTGLQRLGTLVAGVAADSLVRGGGGLFLDLGRRVERAQWLALALATVLDQPAPRLDGALLLALELCDSQITYRGRYLSALQPGPVLDLVLADLGNPRAIASQFDGMDALLAMAGDAALAGEAAAWRERAGACAALVAQSDDPLREAGALPAALRAMAAGAGAISGRTALRFFAAPPPAQAVIVGAACS